MGHLFTGDDEGKDIVTSEGTRIGTVHDVDEDRARVDRARGEGDGEGLGEKLKRMLGWDDESGDRGDDERREIRGEHVDRVDDDRVHLRDH